MTRSVALPVILTILMIILGLSAFAPKTTVKGAVVISNSISRVIEQPHAVEKHGAPALSARDTMSQCKDKYGLMELFSPGSDKWMYVCFLDTAKSIIIQILSGKVEDPLAREITTIPTEHLSKPVQYLKNAISKGGYIVKNTWNASKFPDWWKELPLITQ